MRVTSEAHVNLLERVAWPLAATFALLTLVALVLDARNAAVLGRADTLFLADVWMGLLLPALGAYLVRVGHNPALGLVLLLAGLLSITDVAGQYATYATVVHPDPGFVPDLAAWVAAWAWTPYLLVPTMVPLLHPDGLRLSRAWTYVLCLVVGLVTVITVVSALAPGTLDGFPHVSNPWSVSGASWLLSLERGLSAVVIVILVPVCVAHAVARWWRAAPAERVQLGWFAASTAVMYIALIGGGGLGYPWSDIVLAAALTFPLVIVAVTSQSYVVTRGLLDSREQLVVAREDERQRLHRDLHDGLGGELAGVALQVGATAMTTTDPVAREQLAAIQEQLQTMTRGVRAIVDDLRPPALEELGLEGSLRQQVAQFNAWGILAVTLSVGEPLLEDLPAATQVAAYRIVTEALANVARHAGARRCEVRLLPVQSFLCLEIEDDGIGPPAVTRSTGPSSGNGLASMRARAEELGGRFTFGASGPQGALVRALLPVSTRRPNT